MRDLFFDIDHIVGANNQIRDLDDKVAAESLDYIEDLKNYPSGVLRVFSFPEGNNWPNLYRVTYDESLIAHDKILEVVRLAGVLISYYSINELRKWGPFKYWKNIIKKNLDEK
jgi:hypothetical protein